MSDLLSVGVVILVLVGVAALATWHARRTPVSGALGEVHDYRYDRGLWRVEAARLVVRERERGGDVRVLYRTSATTFSYSCSPGEARRIARALREAARNPLPDLGA